MIEQVTAGVDWLTLTLPLGGTEDQWWKQVGIQELYAIAKQGYDICERSLLGYIGHSCGNCFVGTREDGHMMQFSGRHADSVFESVYRKDAHVSRLDVQVTVTHDVMPKNVAGKGYHNALHQDSGIRPGGKRKIYLITGSDGGQTLYVGAMSSDQRGRLYNKEVQSESPEYVRTWRYEVVLRNERAKQVGDRLLALSSDKAPFIASYVASWWEARGIDAPWEFDNTYAPIPPQKTLPSDVERQLDWLRSQVAPTVARLCANGYRDIVHGLLGLARDPHAREDGV
jgi:DNA relaxase NicK